METFYLFKKTCIVSEKEMFDILGKLDKKNKKNKQKKRYHSHVG